ncbi:MAG: hypothetical protein HDT43_00730 [Ruminococcaceae bacterium]|nr:hypothetical protein [Oscillospiraceae bacterium]
MNLTERINVALALPGVPVSVMENPTDSGKINKFIVIIPENDDITYADDKPLDFVEGAALQLYCKGNYLGFRDEVTNALIAADITISSRRYMEYEQDTGYHHYIIEVAGVN